MYEKKRMYSNPKAKEDNTREKYRWDMTYIYS